MDFHLLNEIALSKYKMCKNDPFRFFMRSIVAGLYLGLATILSYTLGCLLFKDNPIAAKIAFSGAFGIGLVIIVILGSELFTGNCFTTMIPVYHKTLKIRDIIPMWVICYIGNFIGVALVVFLFIKSGSNSVILKEYLTTIVNGKMDFDIIQLVIKGTLCNFIVCAGAYTGMKVVDETAKTVIMMIVVMAFVLPGFEHSIANMGTFTMAYTFGLPLDGIQVAIHMIFCTIGNILGGSVLLGLPIYLMARIPKEGK